MYLKEHSKTTSKHQKTMTPSWCMSKKKSKQFKGTEWQSYDSAKQCHDIV